MEPTPALVDRLFEEEITRARAMSSEDKLLEGPRLFDRACQLMADGIRHRHPDADDDRVLHLLRAQLTVIDRLERRRTAPIRCYDTGL